jgi:hypothetical protein
MGIFHSGKHAYGAHVTRQAIVILRPQGADLDRIEASLEQRYSSVAEGIGLVALQFGILVYARRMQREKQVA